MKAVTQTAIRIGTPYEAPRCSDAADALQYFSYSVRLSQTAKREQDLLRRVMVAERDRDNALATAKGTKEAMDSLCASYRAEIRRLKAELDAPAVSAQQMEELRCQEIWWPKELPFPFFEGPVGNRTIARWSRFDGPLSSGWHWMADVVDPVTVGLTPPPDKDAFPIRALRHHDQQTGVRTR